MCSYHSPSLLHGPRKMLRAIERGGHAGGPKGRYWVLDPVDGTKGFLRGQQYAICLALIEEGQVKLGVLGCPRLPLHGVTMDPAEEEEKSSGTLVAAVQDQGAYQVGVSKRNRGLKGNNHSSFPPAL